MQSARSQLKGASLAICAEEHASRHPICVLNKNQEYLAAVDSDPRGPSFEASLIIWVLLAVIGSACKPSLGQAGSVHASRCLVCPACKGLWKAPRYRATGSASALFEWAVGCLGAGPGGTQWTAQSVALASLWTEENTKTIMSEHSIS